MAREAGKFFDVQWVAQCARRLRERWPHADVTSLEEAAVGFSRSLKRAGCRPRSGSGRSTLSFVVAVTATYRSLRARARWPRDRPDSKVLLTFNRSGAPTEVVGSSNDCFPSLPIHALDPFLTSLFKMGRPESRRWRDGPRMRRASWIADTLSSRFAWPPKDYSQESGVSGKRQCNALLDLAVWLAVVRSGGRRGPPRQGRLPQAIREEKSCGSATADFLRHCLASSFARLRD
jgi:hypothetical protein